MPGLEVEVRGSSRRGIGAAARAAAAAGGASEGHLAISFVGEEEMRRLNLEHRGQDHPTDVLSFPVDGRGESAGPRELGDVVICLEQTADVHEAVVHGVLHLLGYDHARDRGEMLELQDRVLAALR